jgi:hypothetical protein
MIYGAAAGRVVPVPAADARKLTDRAGWLAPLVSPAIADVIDVILFVDPAMPWPKHFFKRHTRPTVVLVGDDPYPAGDSLGPDAWRCTPQLRAWCRAAIIHGTGARADHYAPAAGAALRIQRVAFIECDSLRVRAWQTAIHCPKMLTFLPPVGKVHPSCETGVSA